MNITSLTDFQEFPKMARLSREVIISEKIDGTSAQVCITDDGKMLFGSRNRWVTPEQDNYGFARWGMEHREELLKLGPGRHFGEWWGQGIQRNYGLTEKRFSLFNVARWCAAGETPKRIQTADPRIEKYQDVLPACCHLVPVLRRGIFTTDMCESALHELRERGSLAAPGFLKPEGIVCFHVAGGVGFKKTLENDQSPKSLITETVLDAMKTTLKDPDFVFTHCNKNFDFPWIAIHRESALICLYDCELIELQKNDIGHLMAAYGRLLDEAGLIHYGKTKGEAVAKAVGLAVEGRVS